MSYGRGRNSAPRVAKIRRTQVQAYGDRESWEQISRRVLERDGYRCRDCHKGRGEVRKLEVHHIIPTSRGGRTAMYNLKTLCDRCHDRQPFHSHLQTARSHGRRR